MACLNLQNAPQKFENDQFLLTNLRIYARKERLLEESQYFSKLSEDVKEKGGVLAFPTNRHSLRDVIFGSTNIKEVEGKSYVFSFLYPLNLDGSEELNRIGQTYSVLSQDCAESYPQDSENTSQKYSLCGLMNWWEDFVRENPPLDCPHQVNEEGVKVSAQLFAELFLFALHLDLSDDLPDHVKAKYRYNVAVMYTWIFGYFLDYASVFKKNNQSLEDCAFVLLKYTYFRYHGQEQWAEEYILEFFDIHNAIKQFNEKEEELEPLRERLIEEDLSPFDNLNEEELMSLTPTLGEDE